MNTHQSSKIKALPLQLVLIIPFVLQIFAAVSLVGYLSFRNGEKAVNALAEELIERTSNTVIQYLNSYLSIPHQVSQINADAIRMKLLDVRDRKAVGKYFWHQMQVYDLTYISLNLATGEAAGAARYDGKTVTIDDSVLYTPSQPQNNTTYLTDNDGNRTQIKSYASWNVFKEPSYTEPVKAGKPIWVRIYTYYDPAYPPYVVASVGHPVYDANKKLIGVVGAEIHLLKLSEFLRNSEVSRFGQVFIMERNGMLVANSTPEEPFIMINNEIKRLKATDSANPIVQSIAQQIQQQIPNLKTITTTQKFQATFQNEHYHLNIIPWHDQYGLDWLIITSIPENAFMAKINANTKITIFLCFGALLLATGIGFFTSRWIARPILRLNQASQGMARGNLQQRVQPGNIQEFNTLAQSFNQMAEQLYESFSALEKSNEVLEERVEARTLELKTTLNELQRTQAQVIQSEKMSSLGQLVAGVAHEINNPVNFIHGNLIHTQEYIDNLLDFLRLYQQYYPEPVAEIQTFSDEIDAEFLQDDLPKILSSMKMGTERIREIVSSLRNFSRMDEAALKEVDIHQGIDSTLLILQHRLKANGQSPEITVIKEYGQLPLINCYASALNQVFMNILSNAIDALQQAQENRTDCQWKPTLVIQTSLNDSGNLVIGIADNGLGIEKSLIHKIFDPFFTTKPIGSGTGLGLSISYSIVVEKHQGQLSCISELGEGTKFVIEIPVRA